VQGVKGNERQTSNRVQGKGGERGSTYAGREAKKERKEDEHKSVGCEEEGI
jgi:hypothetical protein